MFIVKQNHLSVAKVSLPHVPSDDTVVRQNASFIYCTFEITPAQPNSPFPQNLIPRQLVTTTSMIILPAKKTSLSASFGAKPFPVRVTKIEAFLPPGKSGPDEERHGHGAKCEHDHRPRLAVLVVEAARRRVARGRVLAVFPTAPQNVPLRGQFEHLRKSSALYLERMGHRLRDHTTWARGPRVRPSFVGEDRAARRKLPHLIGLCARTPGVSLIEARGCVNSPPIRVREVGGGH